MLQGSTKPSDKNHFHATHIRMLVSSYKLHTGENIIEKNDDIENIAREIFFLPFAVISHGTEVDPIFNYANQCALNLFEMTWNEFIRTPSRLSAKSNSQDERNRLLKSVSENGYVNDYSGVRISKKGKHFQVSRATIWNVIDQEHYYGQAAFIKAWVYI